MQLDLAYPCKLHSKEFSLINAVKRAFHEGKLVLMFPEGKPGMPGKLDRFKPGVPRILLEYFHDTVEAIPAFPVGVQGTHRFFRPWMKLGLHVGEPIFIQDYICSTERETMSIFNDALERKIKHLSIA